MKKDTITIVEYLENTPIFATYAKDIMASRFKPNQELSANSLLSVVKECSVLIHKAGNMLLHNVNVHQQREIKILIFSSLASLCAILNLIAHSPSPLIVLPNFVQNAFIDLLNNLRSIAIVLRDFASAADVADEILQISLNIIAPFFSNNLIVAHPIVHNKKQILSETKFLYAHMHIYNIVKFMHTCHSKIHCDSGDAVLAMQSLIFSQNAHEASRLETSTPTPIKIPQHEYEATLRQQFKTCADWRSAKLQNYSPFKDNKSFICDQNYAIAMIYFTNEFENLELAECHLDMVEKLFPLIQTVKDAILLPVSIADGYIKISELLQVSKDTNREVRCLLKAKKCYEQMMQVINNNPGISAIGNDIKASAIKYKNILAQIKTRLLTLEKTAFKILADDWSNLADQYTDYCRLTFDHQHVRLMIECLDLVYMKGLSRQLRLANIQSHNQEIRTITISEPAKLKVNELERFFIRTQRDLNARRKRIEKALLAKAEASSPQSPIVKSEPEHELSLSGSALFAQYKSRTKPAKATKGRAVEPKTEQPNALLPITAKPQLPDIDWGEDFPKFIYGKSQVYAFPNPEIHNTAMIKGTFFGYIDVDQLQELEEELLERFEEQLALGMLSNEEKAQGIRPITGSEANNTDYIFKINIGAQDLRLYGRKVAIVIVDENPRTLICFDQTVPHNKKLKPAQTESVKLI